VQQFRALPVEQTFTRCADEGGCAWLPLSEKVAISLRQPFLKVSTDIHHRDQVTPDVQGLCIKEISLSTSFNTIERADTMNFRERPGAGQPQTQTISQCKATGGFAWWPLLQHHHSVGPAVFFRIWKDMLPPTAQDIVRLQGKCVKHIVGAPSTYVTVCMFRRRPTHWSQKNV
jgi:hypothetical protein